MDLEEELKKLPPHQRQQMRNMYAMANARGMDLNNLPTKMTRKMQRRENKGKKKASSAGKSSNGSVSKNTRTGKDFEEFKRNAMGEEAYNKQKEEEIARKRAEIEERVRIAKMEMEARDRAKAQSSNSTDKVDRVNSSFENGSNKDGTDSEEEDVEDILKSFSDNVHDKGESLTNGSQSTSKESEGVNGIAKKIEEGNVDMQKAKAALDEAELKKREKEVNDALEKVRENNTLVIDPELDSDDEDDTEFLRKFRETKDQRESNIPTSSNISTTPGSEDAEKKEETAEDVYESIVPEVVPGSNFDRFRKNVKPETLQLLGEKMSNMDVGRNMDEMENRAISSHNSDHYRERLRKKIEKKKAAQNQTNGTSTNPAK